MRRVTKAAPIALVMVLLLSSVGPMLAATNDTENPPNEADYELLPANSELWPAGARAGATSWLKDVADSDGDTGKWTSSAIADDGTIWVSFYSAAGRDLMVAKWTGYSWQISTVYSFGDMGKYSQIALDSSGNPRIACYDVTNGVLRISRFDGNLWDTQTVAPGENTGNGDPYEGAGRIGLAIDDGDSEWFSFYIEDETTSGTWDKILAFAHWDSSDSTWAYGHIDEGQGEHSEFDDWTDTGKYSSLIIGNDGRPHVAYNSEIWDALFVGTQLVDYWAYYSLRYAFYDGTGWSSSDIHVNETGNSYLPAQWLELVADDSGDEYIAYQNVSRSWGVLDSIRLATKSGGTWSHELIANGSTDIGKYVRIDLDISGDLHILHQDDSLNDLILMRGTAGNWETITIDSQGEVGDFPDLVLNSNGEEIISYNNGNDDDLIIATPAADADGDGIADAADRCINSPAGKVIDDSGCHYEQQILTTSGEDTQYVDAVMGDDGLLRLTHFRGLPDGVSGCDQNPANNSDDCNLVYRKQNSDGSWGNPEIIDQGGETGRYNSMEISPDGTESIAFHAKSAIDEGGFVSQTAAKIATNSGSGWTIETIAEDNNTGWYTDLAVDSNGNRAVSYTDNTDSYSTVKLARETSPGVWNEEVIQVNASFARVDFVNDIAHVSYYSSNPEMVRLAIDDGQGGWTIHNVTTSGEVGFFRLDTEATDDNRLLINFFRGRDTSSDTSCDAPQECTVQVAEWNGSEFTYHILHQDTSEFISYLSVEEDVAGNIHSTWYNGAIGSLQIASPTSTGWETLTLIEAGTGGTYPHMLVDENGWEQIWYHGGNDETQLLEIKRFAWESDHDFVINDNDQCPDTPYGAEGVNIWGCANSQLDDDYDGTANSEDLCPNTPGFEGHLADEDGCSPSQKDSDEDGTNDAQDLCPGTTDIATVDETGCSDEQRDSDDDGVKDNTDQCPDTPPGDSVDLNGCGESQRDNDDDGVNDKDDFMPQDSSQQYDTDSDGFGDNSEGTNGDDCPNQPGSSTGEMQGCPDLDEDGIANDIDEDDDGDGYSDADEIANGTDPLYALDFPGIGEDNGGDGNDGTDGGDGNSDGNGDGNSDVTGETEGVSLAIVGGIAAVIVLLLIAVAALLLTGGKKSDPSLPGIPSLAEAEAALNASTASQASQSEVASSTSGEGEKGEMIPTGNACKHCGAMEVVHIPAYGADYCNACSQYN